MNEMKNFFNTASTDAIGDMPSANRTWGAYLQKQGYKPRMVSSPIPAAFRTLARWPFGSSFRSAAVAV